MTRRARLDGPAEARMLALSEGFADAVIARLESSRTTRNLIGLVQELDGDLYGIEVIVHGRRSTGGKRFGASVTVAARSLGIAPPAVEVDDVRPERPRKPRKRKPRPAA